MIVVTGGAGFIGSAMVWELNKLGREDILVVDNLAHSRKWKNLVPLRFIDYVHKDEFLSKIEENSIDSIEAIFHMGACSATTETDANYLYRNNYLYTRTLASYALANNARFIYASSAATYGGGEHGFSDDEAGIEKLSPINMYGYSKQLFDVWAKKKGILDKIAGLKFYNVYGPNEYHKGDMSSVIFKAFHQIEETGKLKLFKSYKPEYADGEQKRDFVYVKDVTATMAWLMENTGVNGLFNIGSGKARSWNDLAHAVFKSMNREANIEYIDMPENLKGSYQYYTEASMEKLIQRGYDKPYHQLEQGVTDYVENYLAKNQAHLEKL